MARKKVSEMTAEEQERQRALSRARNAKYLAKEDPEVKLRRAEANKRYLAKLHTDPDCATVLADRQAKAVARTAIWQREHPDKVKQHARTSRQAYPEREVAKVQRRNAQKLKAIPSWADPKAIERHYANSRYLTEVTGYQHHVDHIIPLRGENVCGLHVENNLRAIPHYLNTRKGNKLTVEA
jgi:hypothetical protein